MSLSGKILGYPDVRKNTKRLTARMTTLTERMWLLPAINSGISATGER
jgi:hypothetical protein